MKRVSIFLREDQIYNLEKISKDSGISYSEMIREAVDYKILQNFSKSPANDALGETRGLLKERFGKKVKSTDLISSIRAEWEDRIERVEK